MFKLIILIMLIYILAYIVDMIYFEVYLYPKILEEELKKEKLLEDENVNGMKVMNSTDFLENKIKNDETMTVDELLTYIVNDITELNERLKVCEHMLYLDDEDFKNSKG